MFKKRIKYTDFNGIDREEDFYFHMSRRDAVKIEAKFGGVPVETYANNLLEKQDPDAMIKFLEDMILSAYGEKTDDGRSFLKTEAVRTKFENSQAYAELFEELLTVPGAAEVFANKIVEKPVGMQGHETKK